MTSILRRIVAGPPPAQTGAPFMASGEVGLYGLGVGPGGMMTRSGPPAPIATVAAIISIISQTCGQLPREVLRDDLRDRKPVRDPRFRYLTGKPNDYDAMSGNTFWESLFASGEGWGNGYAWIDRFASGYAGVVGLHFLMPQLMRPFREEGSRRVRYRMGGDQGRSYGSDEILHIAKNAYDGIEGMSPIRAGAMTHSLAQQQERTALTFFRRGTTVGGIVMAQEEMDESEVREFYENFRAYHQGGAQAGNVLLLTNGAKYERVGIPPNEAQFLESRQFSREEIVSWYAPGIPHHLLGWRSNASNWGTGVEQQSIGFVKYVLLSRLRRVEEVVSELFLSDGLRFEFRVDELLRGDTRVRGEMHQRMRQAGVLSADEWRMREGMAPRGIPDDYLEPMNMTRVDARTGRRMDEPEAPGRRRTAAPAAMLLDEMRCGNASCRSRANGAKGALLARSVGAAEVVCDQCGEVTRVRAGHLVRDERDISDALDAELARRLR